MTPEEQAVADKIDAAIYHFMENTERTLQAKSLRIGCSDVGFCSTKVLRMLAGEESDGQETMMPALIGSAVGDYVEQAVAKSDDTVITQASIEVTLRGDSGRQYVIAGHPDIIWGNLVLDCKAPNGTAVQQRRGPSAQQQYQRNLYALGAWEQGLLGDIPLDEVRVGNVWIDRSGQEEHVYVQIEAFNPEVVREAGQWIDEIVEAYLNGHEVMKEPPREVCARFCGYYSVCRALDTDAEGLITDEKQLIAVDMYREGMDLEKQGSALKSQAKAVLQGVNGSTGEWLIRWVHVGPVETKPSIRAAHDKISFSKVK